MYCSNCGKQIDDNAVVCIHCGAAANNRKAQSYDPNAKSKLAAGLLGIFLGSFGVHNFYLGYTGKAIAQLVLTVATCGIGGAISGVWGLVEGILLLTGSIDRDGQGNPLRD